MMGSAGTAETTGVRGGRLQFRAQRVVDIHMPMTFLNSNFSHLLPLVCAFTMYTPQTVVKQLEETIREYNNNMQQQGLTHVMIDHIVVPLFPYYISLIIFRLLFIFIRCTISLYASNGGGY